MNIIPEEPEETERGHTFQGITDTVDIIFIYHKVVIAICLELEIL